MRRKLGVVLVSVVLAAGSAACGGKTDEKARAAGITPATAIGLVTVSLDPSIEQKRNLISIAKKFPGAKVKDEFAESRDELLDQLLEDSGLDYEKDVKPWLGNEIAVAVMPGATAQAPPEPVVMIKVEDEGKAKAALDKAKAQPDNELGAYRFIEDYAVVVGDSPGAAGALDAIDKQADADSGSLAESDKFNGVVGELKGDRLVLGWVDAKRAFDAAVAAAGDEVPLPVDVRQQLANAGPVAFDFHAAPDAFVVEGVARATVESKGKDPRLTEGLPASTLGAFTMFDLGSGITTALSAFTGTGEDAAGAFKEATGLDLTQDILSWMHGEMVVVAGPPPGEGPIPKFGVVIEPTDRAKAEAAIPRMRAAIAQQAGGEAFVERPIAGTTAYVLAEPVEEGIQPAMALFADRFVIASSPEYLAELSTASASPLGGTEAYKSVVAEGTSGKTQMQLVLQIDPIRELLEKAFGMTEDADYMQNGRPNVEPLDTFGMRSYRVGAFDRFEVKLTVS